MRGSISSEAVLEFIISGGIRINIGIAEPANDG